VVYVLVEKALSLWIVNTNVVQNVSIKPRFVINVRRNNLDVDNNLTRLGVLNQQYPPGTQNTYVGFLNLFVITETGKELNYPTGGRGS
jgi:hypothetical protein